MPPVLVTTTSFPIHFSDWAKGSPFPLTPRSLSAALGLFPPPRSPPLSPNSPREALRLLCAAAAASSSSGQSVAQASSGLLGLVPIRGAGEGGRPVGGGRYSQQIRPVPMEDGAEGQAVPEGAAEISDLHARVALALAAAPGLQGAAGARHRRDPASGCQRPAERHGRGGESGAAGSCGSGPVGRAFAPGGSPPPPARPPASSRRL